MLKKKLLIIMLLQEYCKFLDTEKGKNFDRAVEKQLKKDQELSNAQFVKKYIPLVRRIEKDKEFNKWWEEQPIMACEDCGSTETRCHGKSKFDKKVGCQLYSWECKDCGSKWEASINDKYQTM